MNISTLKRMQYFVGKVCSIISSQMNRSFDEKISREHFVIRIEAIDEDGIWGTHPYNNDIVSYFNMSHIISMHEEFEIDPSDPEHAKMIEEFEEETGNKFNPDFEQKETAPSPEEPEAEVTFVDIENLEKLAENTKRNFDQYKDSLK